MLSTRSSLLALFLLLLPIAINAQNAPSEAERLLDLRSAEINERQASATLVQHRDLHARGLISKAELDRAEAEASRAALDSQRARLSLANELPSFRVVSAVKSVAESGAVEVALTLAELERGYDEAIHRRYLVSLASGGVIAADPYQQQVSLDGRGRRTVTLRFRMLKDTDEVTVLVLSGTRREELPILLQRDRSSNRLQMGCSNFSQEGVLGGKVEYRVRIDRFASGTRSATLTAEGLPPVFTTEWLDVSTNAKLSSIQFADNQNAVEVMLRVFLPLDGDASWLGKTIPFRAAAVEGSGPAQLTVGSVNLELRPAGAPKLNVSTDQILTTLAPGETKSVAVRIQNLGGAPARDVLFEFNPPAGIDVRVDPAIVPMIGPRETASATVRLTAAHDVVPADYDLKLQARTQTRLANVDSPELSLRVEVKTAMMSMATLSTSLLLLSSAVVVVIWGVRRIRR